MKLFIDCEFNEFKGELISMAIIDEDGVFFYEVLPCQNPGPWVAQHVMPILEKKPIRLDQLQFRLMAFLSHYEAVHLIADWPEDIQHFCAALITGPGERINTPPLTMEVRRDLDAISHIPHNALADAFAIRAKYMEVA